MKSHGAIRDRQPRVRQFDVQIAECAECGNRLQGRHALQTSDALGAAAVQLGPDAQAALVILNKEFGLSHGKSAAAFQRLFGLTINRSTSVRSVLRTAKRLEPAAREIRRTVRGSPQITCDETGWRIGGEKAWLHVAVVKQATWYEVARTRDHTVLENLIGLDYPGRLIHDGWSVDDRFQHATHQQCVAHILRRARDWFKPPRVLLRGFRGRCWTCSIRTSKRRATRRSVPSDRPS